MTRSLSSAVAAGIAAESLLRTVAVELDFASGMVRVNGSPADLTIGGNQFLGLGGLGAISIVDESAELRAYDLSLQLSGVPPDSIALVLTEAYQGRRGTVWEVLLDTATYLPIADPITVFRGRMDQMDVSLGQMATVTVKLLNRLADWERPRIQRYTDVDQERLHPGDTGLRYVAGTVEKQLIWPGASWWDKSH